MVFSETISDSILIKIKNDRRIAPSTPPKTPHVEDKKTILCSANTSCKSFISRINGKTILGKGSFGRVILDEIFGNEVAVKICPRSSCQCLGERNALVMKHENVVRLNGILEVDLKDVIDYMGSGGLPLDIFKRFGAQIVVMELAGRQTLQQLLDDSEQEISAERRNHLINQIACGIRYCHDSKVIHLDIKPANVMVMSGDICKLVDFGSSKRTDIQHKCSHELTLGKRTPMGTVIYCAPEILSNKLVTPKADVYSFGITMWQIFTRLIPFNDCESHSVIYRVVSGRLRPPLNTINVHESNLDYIDLMVNCWNHDLNKRPNSSQVCLKLSQFNASSHRLSDSNWL